MIPITMMGAYVMLGLEMIGEEIEQPFGLDSNDLPITLIANRIRVSVHEVLGVELTHVKKALATPPYSVVH
jgi:putative membrane protein